MIDQQTESLKPLFYEALDVGLEAALRPAHVSGVYFPLPISLGWACPGAQVSYMNVAFQQRNLKA